MTTNNEALQAARHAANDPTARSKPTPAERAAHRAALDAHLLARDIRAAQIDAGKLDGSPVVTGGRHGARRSSKKLDALRAVSQRQRATLDARQRAEIDALYRTSMATGAPIPLEEWRDAGGVVTRVKHVKPRPRPVTGGKRLTRMTSGGADASLMPKTSGRDFGVMRSRKGDALSPFLALQVEAFALQVAAALAIGDYIETVAIGGDVREALAAGQPVRLWYTGAAFRDAGSIPGSDDPQHRRAAWHVSADGGGKLRVSFAIGGDAANNRAILTEGSAQRTAAAILAGKVTPDSCAGALSVSLTGK